MNKRHIFYRSGTNIYSKENEYIQLVKTRLQLQDCKERPSNMQAFQSYVYYETCHPLRSSPAPSDPAFPCTVTKRVCEAMTDIHPLFDSLLLLLLNSRLSWESLLWFSVACSTYYCPVSSFHVSRSFRVARNDRRGETRHRSSSKHTARGIASSHRSQDSTLIQLF